MSKLHDRCKQYGIPEIPYLPMGKNVLVWRLASEEKTAGGLILPEAHAEVKARGILLTAGLKARDVMYDALIEIGDEVYFGKYAGAERQMEREAAKVSPKVLEMKIEDINGSVEAKTRLEDFAIVRDDETHEHAYVPVPKSKAHNRKAA